MATDSIDQELLDAFFEDAHDVLEEWERVALSLSATDTVKAYEPILRCAHNLKGSAGLAGFMNLHMQMHAIENYLVKLRDQARSPDSDIVAVFLAIERGFRRWVDQLRETPTHIEDMSDVERELARVAGNAETAASPLDMRQLNKVGPTLPTEKVGREPMNRGDETLRISAAKLDHLIRLVGEISVNQSILDRAGRDENLNTPTIRAVIDLQSKQVQDLQDSALSLRMIPVRALFQKVERLARDVAGHLNKQVQVNASGEEVRLDKLVVDAMLDPLIHISRNAIDHGIESAAERIQAGKTPFGIVTISAENTASGVTIRFNDDGRGIDAERVYARAVEKKLIEPNDAMTRDSKLKLIFLPGLSTKTEVSEYSGRGVGMDIVAESVERMAGRVEIESEMGKGTSLNILLPTNISIIDALIVKVNGSQYALPIQDLVEVINLDTFDIQVTSGGESRAINFRDKVVDVDDLAAFLDHMTPPARIPGKGYPAVLVLYGDHALALTVDSISGQQKIFVRPQITQLAQIAFYGGSTILSDGEPTLILNLPEIARRYFTSH
jgi:two-component system chemotaxis sensor kinase CheA